MQFSEDGQLLAYGLSESGSDWITIKVRILIMFQKFNFWFDFFLRKCYSGPYDWEADAPPQDHIHHTIVIIMNT